MKKYYLILPVIMVALVSLAYLKIFQVTQLFGYTPFSLLNNLYTSYQLAKDTKLADSKSPTILILGVDERNDSLEKTMVSDTLMLTKLNFKNNQLSIVSLPRDLWLDKFKFKVNQLYPYALKNNLDPFTFLKTEINIITGQNVDHVIIINTATFQKISQLIGPVIINLPYELTDSRYPNPEYIQDPKSNKPIYITVHFKQGDNIIDYQNVLPFVRSRKGSDDPNKGGTDLGRIQRQQILLSAYLSKLKETHQINLIAKLYSLYKTDLKTDLKTENLFYYFFGISQPQNLSLIRISIPVNTKDGILFEPNYLVSKQSVILPKDPNWNQLKKYLQTQLP